MSKVRRTFDTSHRNNGTVSRRLREAMGFKLLRGELPVRTSKACGGRRGPLSQRERDWVRENGHGVRDVLGRARLSSARRWRGGMPNRVCDTTAWGSAERLDCVRLQRRFSGWPRRTFGCATKAVLKPPQSKRCATSDAGERSQRMGGRIKRMGRGVQAMLGRMETQELFTLTLALSLRERGGASRREVKPGACWWQ